MITRRFHANALWVNSEYQSQLLALSSVIREPLVNVEAKEFLFHYTTSQGLIGIINSSRLWATNALYLNDASELTYGYSFIKSVISSAHKEVSDPNYGVYLQQVDGMMDDPNGLSRDCYITCFCEEGDLLSQWRAYGNRGVGYAIGFNTSQIGMNVAVPPNFFLRKVLYDSWKQKGIVLKALQSTYSAQADLTAGKSEEEARPIRVLLLHFLQDHLHDMMLGFKHPDFNEEQEWRLVEQFHTTESDDHLQQLKFRNDVAGVLPYIELDISPSAGVHSSKLPIEWIVLGPALHPALSERAVDMLLSKNQYSSVTICQSDIPLRCYGTMGV